MEHVLSLIRPQIKTIESLELEQKAVLLVTLLLAACSILYELMIAHTISLLAANTVVWYSVTVGLYLLGMGLGALGIRFFRDEKRSPGHLWLIEITLCVIGILAVPCIHFGHMLFLYFDFWGYSILGICLFFLPAFVLALSVGFLSGMELPLLIRMANFGERTRTSAVLLGVDYFGSLLGAVAFPILLLPYFEMFTIGFMIAAINVLVALYLAHSFRGGLPLKLIRTIALFSILFILGIGSIKSSDIEQYFLQRFYYYDSSLSDSLEELFFASPVLPTVTRISSPYQKIDLVEQRSKDIVDKLMPQYSTKFSNSIGFPSQRLLFLNGDYQFHSNVEEVYHEYFAHVPIIARESVPQDVLVLGGGDGLLIRELVKYPDIKSITHVDLDSQLINFARENFTLKRMNGGALEDPRVETRFADGYQFIRNTGQKYDAIYIDFPVPNDYNLAKLYSAEFYYFVKQRLNPGGFAVFDATGIGYLTPPSEDGSQDTTELNDWPIYYNTLKKAGFSSILPYVTSLELDNEGAHSLLLSADTLQTNNTQGLQMLDAARNQLEKDIATRLLLRVSIHSTLTEILMAMQQGFIMLAIEEEAFSIEYKNPGVPLHILNRTRYELAFKPEFPRTATVDESKVNSIFRPTFPSTPVWLPRVPM